MFRWLLLIALAVAVALGLLVGILNPDKVNFDLLFFQGSLPLGAIMLLCFISGILLAACFGGFRRLMRLSKRRSG
ncbi:MAG TPA: LapA family protein [Wenzhouxiangella sp.]